MKEIILASTSPRRQTLLKEIGISFRVVSPDFDENIINKQFSYDLIEDVAVKKGESAAKKIDTSALIISADTAVIYNNIVLGKPKDYNDALNILSLLNGKTHIVVTSVCIIDNEKNKKIVKSETSEVTFDKLKKNDLENYINKYKPYDKAGAYGIQELPKNFIKSVNGEYDNIVGLPTKLLIKMLEEIPN